MGVVYAAYDPQLDREVALKLLKASAADEARDVLRDRLLREAQVLARLSHPNVVTVHDAGTYGERVYLAMERIRGVTLRAWLKQTRRSTGEILDVFVALGRGLAAAHDEGIVHRDFKPENVLVGVDGRPRVTDFGLARRGTAAVPERYALTSGSSSASARASDGVVTRTGALIGTPAYMSPEQSRGGSVDARSDQYAWFVALHEALHGVRPDRAPEPGGPVRRVPNWLRRVMTRGLHPEPEQRFPSMTSALAAVSDGRRRRSRIAAGAGVAAALALVGGGSAVVAREHDPCAGADRHVDAVWAQSRREALLQAFLASGRPYAQAMFDSVSARIDAWTGQWRVAHRQACEATRVYEEQSESVMTLRMSCLDQRLRELEAVQTVLMGPGPEIVDRAVDALGAIGDLDVCAHPTALSNRVPPPADPERRSRVEALVAELNLVEALFHAGQYKEGRARAEKAAQQAETIAWAPGTARAQWLWGMYLLRLGHEAEAEPALYRAAAEAVVAGDETLAARAWVGLVRVLPRQKPAEETTDGDPRERFARAFVKRVGDPAMEAGLASALGYVASRRAQHELAARLFEQAIAAHRSADGDQGGADQGGAMARAHMNLGNALSSLNRFDDALVQYEQAREAAVRILGPSHPDVAQVLFNIGISHARSGRFKDAEPALRQALAVFEQALGKDAPQTASAVGMLASVLTELGRSAEALPLQLRSVATLERTGATDNARFATALGNLATALADERRPREALPHATRSLALKEKLLGPDHPSLSYPLITLGGIYLDTGEPRRAVEVLRRALRLQEQHASPPLTVGETRFRLAQALWVTGKKKEARALADRVLEEAGSPEAGELLADTREWLKRVGADR